MYVCTCICAGEHCWPFPLVFLWPAAKTYSWRLPKLEPTVEICVRLHAGTYVHMSMAVGWPKRGSLVCTYTSTYVCKWLTLICTISRHVYHMHRHVLSCTYIHMHCDSILYIARVYSPSNDCYSWFSVYQCCAKVCLMTKGRRRS